MIPCALGVTQGYVRLLLTKTTPCSLHCSHSRGSRETWSSPTATPDELRPARTPLASPSTWRRARNTTRAPTKACYWSGDGLPKAHRPQAHPYGGRRSSRALRRPGCLPRARRPRLRRDRDARSLSAASFCRITSSQKEATACHAFSLPSMAVNTAGSERSAPIDPMRTRRCSSQAGHTSNVCCAVSPGQSQ